MIHTGPLIANDAVCELLIAKLRKNFTRTSSLVCDESQQYFIHL